jgi:hypothetical protein
LGLRASYIALFKIAFLRLGANPARIIRKNKARGAFYFSQRRRERKGKTRKVKIIYYFSALRAQHSANAINPLFPLRLCEIFFPSILLY